MYVMAVPKEKIQHSQWKYCIKQILQRFRQSNPYICLCDDPARVSPQKIKGTTAAEPQEDAKRVAAVCVPIAKVWSSHS